MNARVVTLDPRIPRAEAVVIHRRLVRLVGTNEQARSLAGPDSQTIDAAGSLAVPAFHDAHLHLLSFARRRSQIDCRGARSIADVIEAIRAAAQRQPAEAWIRAAGYDEARLVERRHPDRADLDVAAPTRPVRLQHRSLHLDVINSAGLAALGMADDVARGFDAAFGARIERDAAGRLTGRIYNGGELLRRHREPRGLSRIEADVGAASAYLLSRGITCVQDATFTNGPEELALFQRLADEGTLRVRLVLFRGAGRWREVPPIRSGPVRTGPIKIMLDEASSNPDAVRGAVREAREAGQPVALHAATEAELAIAIDALQAAPVRSPRTRGPDRIEHGAVIPDEALASLRELRLAVVGQPALVSERGDVYRERFAHAQHPWIHRAGSLVRAGISYAVGSDAPVTDPDPLRSIAAARTRTTPDGRPLGPDERLTARQALAAHTLGPARAIGAASKLGRLREGALGDIVLLDPDALESPGWDGLDGAVRMTIVEGRVVWERGTTKSTGSV